LKSEEEHRLRWFCWKYKQLIPADILLGVCLQQHCSHMFDLYKLHFSESTWAFFVSGLKNEIECTPEDDDDVIFPHVTLAETPAVEVPAHLKVLSDILLKKR
jgi:hypothetical protein